MKMIKIIGNSPTLQKIDTYIRQELKLLLDQCTPEQHHVFKLMYSHKDLQKHIDRVVDDMPKEKLEWAICQAEASINKNKMKNS